MIESGVTIWTVTVEATNPGDDNNNNKFILSPKIPGSSVDSHTQNTQ